MKTYSTSPLKPDTDGDGLDDGVEVSAARTNPIKADTDGDGLPDECEASYGGHLDPDADNDGDGLTNRQECRLGADPTLPDTDGDGMPDGWEAKYGLDPRTIANADERWVRVRAEPQTVLRALVGRDGVKIERFELAEPSLDDIFVAVVRRTDVVQRPGGQSGPAGAADTQPLSQVTVGGSGRVS